MADGSLRARVAARPIDGAANRALVALVARELGVARSRVTVVAGATARSKVLELEAVDLERIRARWPGIEV